MRWTVFLAAVACAIAGSMDATHGGAEAQDRRLDSPPKTEQPPPPSPNDDMALLLVEGGEFDMGCSGDGTGPCEAAETPVSRVSVKSFYLGAKEVTVAQYRAFCRSTKRSMPPEPGWGWLEDHPVISVNWDEATAFCAWAGGRLPTEAEWEYAARERGTNVKFGTGKNELTHDDANFGGLGGRDTFAATAPVGSFAPNALGLYDMAGNVWELTSTCYEPYPYRPEHERGEDAGTCERRVVRGGGYYGGPGGTRATRRIATETDYRSYYGGFRCAKSLTPVLTWHFPSAGRGSETPPPEARAPEPPASEAVGVEEPPAPAASIDCGNDLACFSEAAKTCGPAFVNTRITSDMFGMRITPTARQEVSGPEEGLCVWVTRTTDVTVKYGKDVMQYFLDSGLTREQIEEQREEMERSSLRTCRAAPAKLASVLRNWQHGHYSTRDFEGMKCEESKLPAAGSSLHESESRTTR